MKKIILSALLTVSVTINSQELDEAYLNSLPEGVREDVEERFKAKDELEKPVYIISSTFIYKENNDEEYD